MTSGEITAAVDGYWEILDDAVEILKRTGPVQSDTWRTIDDCDTDLLALVIGENGLVTLSWAEEGAYDDGGAATGSDTFPLAWLVASGDERDRLIAEHISEKNRRREEASRAYEASRIAKERAEYERLKAKFES